MIWFFQREGKRLLYEIRRSAEGDGFELVVTYPDGRVRTERFDDSSALLRRSIEVQRELIEEGWAPPLD